MIDVLAWGKSAGMPLVAGAFERFQSPYSESVKNSNVQMANVPKMIGESLSSLVMRCS